jgi:hypothetical protein
MALVEGLTLAECIARGSIPLGPNHIKTYNRPSIEISMTYRQSLTGRIFTSALKKSEAAPAGAGAGLEK